MATAALIISTVVSAYAAYQQAEYQKDMAEYNAQLAEANAVVATQQSEKEAQLILEEGAAAESSFRKEARAIRGSNIKNIAMSGITMTGSPLLVMNEIAEQTELEAYQIRRKSKIEAEDTTYKGGLAAAGLTQEAASSRSYGSYAYSQGMMGAGATLLQGGSKIYNRYQANKAANKSWWQ